ncbi:MAG: SNF2-related protein [Raoultibacter sp.]
MTDYHARYYAYLLTHAGFDSSVRRYRHALFNASIDLHPHQLDAALFAECSPFGEATILADEEGLGKTIEAGIVLAERYYEGRTKLLVLVPGDYVDFWTGELTEKFGLPVCGLGGEGVQVISYAQAAAHRDAIAQTPWDLCVLDEAHRLACDARASTHDLSGAIHGMLRGRKKLLLTATPMQNSLMDLFYLVRFADETVFGPDPEVFRKQYIENKALRGELAERAQQICYRTLRRYALTMRPTKRIAWTISFEPGKEETILSKRLSLYLHREGDDLKAFPKIQSHYIRLTLYNLLSSSSFALRETLEKVYARLETIPGTEDERRELREVIALCEDIQRPRKFDVLLSALKEGFARVRKSGAAKKAVVFVESRATLTQLKMLLTENKYAVRVYGEKDALDDFCGRSQILLAADKASERPDLSFCSMVVNYDLPWNPQKLEQRVSRCHRYGQKYDVLTVNLIDPTNRFDRRVWAVLNKKLKQFDDTFGASDALLGKFDADTPRSKSEIEADEILFQEEHQEEIERETRRAEAELLSHFDEQVAARFRLHEETARVMLPEMADWLWQITKAKLRVQFDDKKRAFILDKSPCKGLRLNAIHFTMDASAPRFQRYRLDHPLAKHVLDDCLFGELLSGELTLEAGDDFASGEHGVMGMGAVTAYRADDISSDPVFTGYTQDGRTLTPSECEGLMRLNVIKCARGEKWTDEDTGETFVREALSEREKEQISARLKAACEARQREIVEALSPSLDAEIARIRRYRQDEELSAKLETDELAQQIKALRTKASTATGFAERFSLNKQAADLGKRRSELEQAKFMRLAALDAECEKRVENAKIKARVRFSRENLFLVAFKIT